MKLSEKIVLWLKNYFEENSLDTAILGISGGKDSAVVAALLCRAIGAENVFGVMMPNGVQSDIDDSIKVIEHLGIRSCTVNIGPAYNALLDELKSSFPVELGKEAKVNISPRLRMSTVYAVCQSLSESENRRAVVVGTGNASETYVGYFTKWGDGAYDINPLKDLWVHEVRMVGDELGLPHEIVHKTPADGLGTQTDEEKLGVSYEEIYNVAMGNPSSKEFEEKVNQLHRGAGHKVNPVPYFKK